MASQGGHVDESAGLCEQAPVVKPPRNLDDSEKAIIYFCLATLKRREGDAVVVNQIACTPEECKLCPVDGPGNNGFLVLSPGCTIFSAITNHVDFPSVTNHEPWVQVSDVTHWCHSTPVQQSWE